MAREGRKGLQDRINRILALLEEKYGKATYFKRFEPMDELVSCILSQHTSDANSLPAFGRLKDTFSEWADVVQAGPARIAPIISSAGLANQKSKSIDRVLREIKERNGDYTIDNLQGMDLRAAREWLESLPGVGPKTASIVLCFSFNMPAIPVDTHIFRVSRRLGVIDAKTDANKAHDKLLGLIDPGDAYRYHVLLIQHGRATCKARNPQCGECPLFELCTWKEKRR